MGRRKPIRSATEGPPKSGLLVPPYSSLIPHLNPEEPKLRSNGRGPGVDNNGSWLRRHGTEMPRISRSKVTVAVTIWPAVKYSISQLLPDGSTEMLTVAVVLE